MIKIRRTHILLFLIFIAALMALSGCAKPECRTSADCASKTCFLSKCESKKCAYTLQPNCCGNKIAESAESGKPGSACTCPEDYGKCEGKGKIRIGSRTEDASYASYHCNVDNKCVLGIRKEDVSPQNFLDQINPGYFKASSILRYNKPFEAARDNFELKLSLDDAGNDLTFPVRLTRIKMFYSSENARAELLIAEKDLGNVLSGISDYTTISLPLTLNYRPQEIEETGSLRYGIDYSYTRHVLSGRTANGTGIYTNETARASFYAPAKPILFVRSG